VVARQEFISPSPYGVWEGPDRPNSSITPYLRLLYTYCRRRLKRSETNAGTVAVRRKGLKSILNTSMLCNMQAGPLEATEH
jgi:hypothetical protein